MQPSKLTFDQLMIQLKNKRPRKQSLRTADIQYVMELVKLMSKSRKQMDFLNKEFDKHFFVNPELKSFFKR